MKKLLRVHSEQLKNYCDVSQFKFKTTADISPLEGLIGQERARKAFVFGLKVKSNGHNIFMTGLSGAGKTTFARTMAKAFALVGATPADWLYLYNFEEREKPKAIQLPAGKGLELREAMKHLLEEVKKEIPRVFAGEQFERLKSALLEEFYSETSALYQELENFSREYEFAISKTATGLASMPLMNGQPVSQEDYENLPDPVKEDIQNRNRKVQEKMNETMRRYREVERETKIKVADLEKQVAMETLEPLFKELRTKFQLFAEVTKYCAEVERDIIDNLEIFTEREETPNPMLMFKRFTRISVLNRYQVNLLVDNSQTKGQPVIEETNPTFSKLFGSIDYEGEFGVLATDFTKLKRGAIHAANGGYLILQAIDLIRTPLLWDALKRVLRNSQITIESVFRNLNLGGAVTLEPEPIPVSIKVILIGEPYLYDLLHAYDEEFRKLFKVKADFDFEIKRETASVQDYARFISSVCHKEAIPHFEPQAVARIVEFSSREVENQSKISLLFNKIAEIVVEAATWAQEEGSAVVAAKHVEQALRERVFRSNRYELRIHEAIIDETILIDTEQLVVGQVNGLGVYSLGDHTFGKPSRITAKTYMGEKGVINIERESRLSGQIHDKGVLILGGYLGGQYAQDKPLSLSASLGFEQLYGIIEGDSASSAELFALLSSLSGRPIAQGIAVTGSVNQQGEIQPVGGVNFKIEGFFRVCRDRGLTGNQGVIIPRQNVRNLMLDEEVLEAVAAEKFHIWGISHIDQGIEILMDMPAGIKRADGTFPAGTLHFLVDKQLRQWAVKKARPIRGTTINSRGLLPRHQ